MQRQRTRQQARQHSAQEEEAQYRLWYWPGIPGRGEYVRLAFEASGTPYRDMAREENAGGVEEMLRLLDPMLGETPPLAPPFLQHNGLVIGQTANILLYLGSRLGLSPQDEARGLWTHQLQLTITDLVAEIHDTHHPLSGNLYYEDQQPEARKRAADFLAERLPKFLGYFEEILEHRAMRAEDDAAPLWIAGPFTYVDLSLFQTLSGLQYAFPRAMKAMRDSIPHLQTLQEAVRQLPRIADYLASPRRLAFNEQGIFRHYPELDRA